MIELNYFNVTLFIGAIVGMLSAFLVYHNHSRQPLNRTWFWLSIVTTVWSLGYFTMISTTSFVVAEWANHILHAAASFIPVVFLQFVAELTKQRAKQKKIIYLAYILAAIFLILNPSQLLLTNVTPKFIFHWVSDAGPLFIVYTYNFFIWVIYAEYLLYRSLRTLAGLRGQQVKYVLLTTLIGFTGGASVFYLTFDSHYPPYPLLLFALYPLVITYAIARYRLMDVRLVLSRIFQYILHYITALVLIEITFSLLSIFPAGPFGFSAVVTSLVLAGLHVFLFNPFHYFFARLTGQIFYRGQADYKESLRTLTQIISREVSRDGLLASLTKELESQFKVKSAEIYLPDKTGRFSCQRAGKLNFFPTDSPLLNFLNKERQILITEEVEQEQADTINHELTVLLETLLVELHQKQIAFISPIVAEGKMVGIFSLGEKKSRDIFTQEDLGLVELLVPQIATALVKAQLYDEAQQFNVKLKKAKVRMNIIITERQPLDSLTLVTS
ncbi:MAG: hypothetical protein NTY61_03830 [Candidatus Parcubacteria bacterium]|nr:hypothetical protein [Candidatus Parcubacteria bacterium]